MVQASATCWMLIAVCVHEFLWSGGRVVLGDFPINESSVTLTYFFGLVT